MLDDTELLRRYAREGDQAAFGELVGRHIDVVYAVAVRRLDGDAHAAEDVVLHAFTRLAQKAATLERHTAIIGWLHAATRYAAADWRRCERSRQAREQLSADFALTGEATNPTMEPHTDAVTNWEQLRPWLDQALDGLSAADRDAVLLRYFSSRSWPELARQFGVAEDTVRRRVERALNRLAARLRRQGIVSTAAALEAALEAVPATAAPAGLAAAVSTKALSAAATAVSATSFATFMSTVKTNLVAGVALLAGASVIGTGFLATQFWRERQDAEVARATEIASLAAARARLASAKARLAVLEKDLAKPAPRVAAPSVAPADLSPMERQALILDALASNPEYRALQDRHARLRAINDYGRLFTERNFSPEQREAFLGYMVQLARLQAESQVSLLRNGPPKGAEVTVSASGGVGFSADPELARRRAALMEAFNAQFGSDTLAAYDKGSTRISYLVPAYDVAMALQDARAPITAAQQAKVQSAFAELQFYPGRKVQPTDTAATATETESQLLNRVAEFLTSDQVEAVRAHLIDVRVSTALARKVQYAVFAPAPAAAPGPAQPREKGGRP